VCDALQGGPSPAGETIAIEQLPRGFLCRDGSAPCPNVGNLAWLGRTDAGTRFWVDTSNDSTANQITVSLEQLREVEFAFQSFLKPEAIDPAETVIRVYDSDGDQFEERKVRFGSMPLDILLDMRQREERVKACSPPVPVRADRLLPTMTTDKKRAKR
jgi:hypothetical protein